MSRTDDHDSDPPPLRRVVFSVLASFFGVQGSGRHQEDFTRGRPLVYIAVGLVATLAFILTIWFVVQGVLSAAGA
ncbi:Zn-dependent protease [Thiohalobacter thiocyanaticus]|uniref:Zn-dependent protease n=1 Tax=Thiohalobacter thiocyanaticus TaxID=585455 RepID=A0A1Z4VS27_9GAMM|nr:DUF2970 domain-containing protein [Thiohalobacter thiocyanaticus]BAZ94004.1 Zn-dependent protease [Thiohalobacter thiocyanaticus]